MSRNVTLVLHLFTLSRCITTGCQQKPERAGFPVEVLWNSSYGIASVTSVKRFEKTLKRIILWHSIFTIFLNIYFVPCLVTFENLKATFFEKKKQKKMQENLGILDASPSRRDSKSCLLISALLMRHERLLSALQPLNSYPRVKAFVNWLPLSN